MTTLDAFQLLRIIQLTDSAFPIGGFAHSGGLETYTQAEVVHNDQTLAQLIAVKLESASTTDFIFIQEAMSHYHSGNFDGLVTLDEWCSATKTARETREASEKVGKRLLLNVLNFQEDATLRFYMQAIEGKRCAGHHAIVHGLVYGVLGAEPAVALLSYAYMLANNQATAALKLFPIGQSQVQIVLYQCATLIEKVVSDALGKTLSDFASFSPSLDIRAMQHESLFRRLFIS